MVILRYKTQCSAGSRCHHVFGKNTRNPFTREFMHFNTSYTILQKEVQMQSSDRRCKQISSVLMCLSSSSRSCTPWMFLKVPVLSLGWPLWGLLAKRKSQHQFCGCWLVIQLPYIHTISLRISFAIFPSAIKIWIVLCTSIPLTIINGSSITVILMVWYLGTYSPITLLFFPVLPETQNKHFS